jgi:hypothetical protein
MLSTKLMVEELEGQRVSGSVVSRGGERRPKGAVVKDGWLRIRKKLDLSAIGFAFSRILVTFLG